MLHKLRHIIHPHSSNNYRPRLLHPTGFFAMATIALVFHIGLKLILSTPSLGSVLSYNSSITSEEVLRLTNNERLQENLPPLTLNAQLSNAALAKAANMMQEQYWSHISPHGTLPWRFIQDSGYMYSIAGENLARDFSDTPHMIHAWMTSPTHRSNIMNPKYQDIGIAVVDGKLLDIDTTLVVQMFGSPLLSTGNIMGMGSNTSIPARPTSAGHQSAETLTETPPPNSVLSKTVYRMSRDNMSPLTISKAVFLTLVLLTLLVLIYDALISSRKNTVRIAGKNLAHIFLFIIIMLLLIVQKGGALL